MSNYTPEILFEDNHLIAVNKKAGELVQPDKSGSLSIEENIKQYIKNKYHKSGNVFLGITHRIDRPVSGLVLIARTSKALLRINQMLQDHEIRKHYWAIVSKKPENGEGRLIHYIKRNEQKNISKAFLIDVKDSKKAELTYKVISSSDRYFLLEIELITGRHHQIRAQLQAIECSIKGDLKYGSPRSNPDGSISLHSRKMEFIHPITKNKTIITAPVPEDKLWKYFENSIKEV